MSMRNCVSKKVHAIFFHSIWRQQSRNQALTQSNSVLPMVTNKEVDRRTSNDTSDTLGMSQQPVHKFDPILETTKLWDQQFFGFHFSASTVAANCLLLLPRNSRKNCSGRVFGASTRWCRVHRRPQTISETYTIHPRPCNVDTKKEANGKHCHNAHIRTNVVWCCSADLLETLAGNVGGDVKGETK